MLKKGTKTLTIMNIKSMKRGFVLLLCATGIAACGGIGGTAESPSQNQNTAPVEPIATAISDNVSSKEFSFEQFSQQIVTVDMTEYAPHLSGDYYIIKLYDEDKTYYLGTTPTLSTLELPISLPRHVSTLWLEIFTNQPSSGQIKQEIWL